MIVPRWPFYNDYGSPKKELWKALTTHIIYSIAMAEAPNTMPQFHQRIDVRHPKSHPMPLPVVEVKSVLGERRVILAGMPKEVMVIRAPAASMYAD